MFLAALAEFRTSSSSAEASLKALAESTPGLVVGGGAIRPLMFALSMRRYAMPATNRSIVSRSTGPGVAAMSLTWLMINWGQSRKPGTALKTASAFSARSSLNVSNVPPGLTGGAASAVASPFSSASSAASFAAGASFWVAAAPLDAGPLVLVRFCARAGADHPTSPIRIRESHTHEHPRRRVGASDWIIVANLMFQSAPGTPVGTSRAVARGKERGMVGDTWTARRRSLAPTRCTERPDDTKRETPKAWRRTEFPCRERPPKRPSSGHGNANPSIVGYDTSIT